MAYDPTRGVAVLDGGSDKGPLGETWEYDGTTWQQIMTPSAPSPRFHHRMVWVPDLQAVLLFGGQVGHSGELGDTWLHRYESLWPDEVCDSGLDIDLDGLTDCADPDYDGQPCGPGGQTCSAGSCQLVAAQARAAVPARGRCIHNK